MTTKDVIVFVHGITTSAEPKFHTQQYNEFDALLRAELAKRGQAYPETRIDIEWGHAAGQETIDNILAACERSLDNAIKAEESRQSDRTLNPLRLVYGQLRSMLVLGFADALFYVSEEGKQAVRTNILSSLLRSMNRLEQETNITLTIISHSAGTVIMHDLLYILFGDGQGYKLAPEEDDLLNNFREMIRQQKMRLKCFVTMGSPITPFLVRSATLLEIFHNQGELNGTLDPEKIGVLKAIDHQSLWLNFWDKDDLFAYPVSFLYDDPHNLVRDVYIDVGDGLPDEVHHRFWRSRKVAEHIAAIW